MTEPQAIYEQAQADIVTLSKRTGLPVTEVVKKMLELRILLVVKEITGGER